MKGYYVFSDGRRVPVEPQFADCHAQRIFQNGPGRDDVVVYNADGEVIDDVVLYREEFRGTWDEYKPFDGLRVAQRYGTLQQNVGQDDGTDMLKARVEVMRSLGVTKWGDIELGPEPAKPTSPEDATQRSQQSEAEQKAREQRLKFGASGGPRLRGGST